MPMPVLKAALEVPPVCIYSIVPLSAPPPPETSEREGRRGRSGEARSCSAVIKPQTGLQIHRA